MLVKILGAVDILSGLILLFGAGVKLPSVILLVFGMTLLVKSLFGLLKDFASWIDFSCGLVFILSSFLVMPLVINIIFTILILQKGIFSMF